MNRELTKIFNITLLLLPLYGCSKPETSAYCDIQTDDSGVSMSVIDNQTGTTIYHAKDLKQMGKGPMFQKVESGHFYQVFLPTKECRIDSPDKTWPSYYAPKAPNYPANSSSASWGGMPMAL